MARRNPDAVRPPDLSLPSLSSGDEAAWRESEHDGRDFAGLELSEFEAGNTRFVECRISGGRFGTLALRRSRFVASDLVELQATTLDVADSEWTDVELRGGRIGALLAPGCSFTRVALRGVRSNYLSLRGGQVADLTLTDCRIEELDLGTATVERAVVADSVIERLVLSAGRLRAVDLRTAGLGEIEGITELGGCTIGPDQLTRLAPALAAQLGIRVADPD